MLVIYGLHVIGFLYRIWGGRALLWVFVNVKILTIFRWFLCAGDRIYCLNLVFTIMGRRAFGIVCGFLSLGRLMIWYGCVCVCVLGGVFV